MYNRIALFHTKCIVGGLDCEVLPCEFFGVPKTRLDPGLLGPMFFLGARDCHSLDLLKIRNSDRP